MLCCVAILKCELPLALWSDPRLQRRLYRGEGEEEVRFYWFDAPPVLPVWFEGRLQILQWGNRDRKCRLPFTCCTQKTTVEAGGWIEMRPEPVRIPGNFGIDQGTPFPIKEAIEGIVVRKVSGEPVVYVVCEPAVEYYYMMTRSRWMPCLVNQVF